MSGAEDLPTQEVQMSVEWSFYTGRPSTVIGNLKRSVTQLANNNAFVKVGITVNPKRRWREHWQNDPTWNRLVVVYRSTSLNYVRELERELIAHSIERVESMNMVGGGGGPNSRGGRHYLYILVQKG
jgi:hypothetical protein